MCFKYGELLSSHTLGGHRGLVHGNVAPNLINVLLELLLALCFFVDLQSEAVKHPCTGRVWLSGLGSQIAAWILTAGCVEEWVILGRSVLFSSHCLSQGIDSVLL